MQKRSNHILSGRTGNLVQIIVIIIYRILFVKNEKAQKYTINDWLLAQTLAWFKERYGKYVHVQSVLS